ncbi:MAG: hypothetical protein ACRD3D_12150 [Terriglobia bacterium]
MRCKDVEENAWEGGGESLPEAVRQHVEGCARCRASTAELSRVRLGLRLLGREEPPEPSFGFSRRVLRRLREREERGTLTREPLESAGRRVILATLVLVFTLLLAMIVPRSGPVRHETTLETYWSQAETPEASASLVSYASDWSSVPPAPVLVEPVVYGTSY